MQVPGVGRLAIWRTRLACLQGGLALHDLARPGQPRRYGAQQEAEVVAPRRSAKLS